MKLLCNNITNDNEYKEYIKTRILLFVIIAVLGAITLFVAFFIEKLFQITIDEHQMGFYLGMGTGLLVAGVFLAIRFFLLLNNGEKLKKHRIKNTDERVQTINSKALVVAGLVLIGTIYLGGIIGGLFYPILLRLIPIPIAVFLVSYAIAYKIYSLKS